jgi:hypothetical protein
MQAMFAGAAAFNGDIPQDVSSVTNVDGAVR